MKAELRLAAISATHDHAKKEGLFCFHDQFRDGWVTVPIRGHRESWPVRSDDMWLWIARALRAKGFPPARKLIADIMDEFEMSGKIDGPMLPVSVRIGEGVDAVYLDLGDTEWRSVEITKQGWRVLTEEPGVKFKRTLGTAALPIPVEGGSCKEILKFLNVRPEHEILFLA